MTFVSAHAGHFERAALAARASRHAAQTEFHEDELAPMQIHTMSRHTFANQKRRADIDQLLCKDGKQDRIVGCIFLTDSYGDCYAMVLPPSFQLLLEIRDVLNDRRKFTIARSDEGAASEV